MDASSIITQVSRDDEPLNQTNSLSAQDKGMLFESLAFGVMALTVL